MSETKLGQIGTNCILIGQSKGGKNQVPSNGHPPIFVLFITLLIHFRDKMVSSTKIYSAKNDCQGSPSSRSSSNCRRRNNPFLKVLDEYLVGKNDPADFSKAWRKKFSKHPSWCDADMCLQHINMGNASGNRVALYSRALFQKLLFHLGDFVQEWPKSILVFGILFLFLCCYWLKDVQIETDLVKLWVEQGGRLDEEMNYLGIAKAHYQRRGKREAAAQPIEPKIVNKASEVAELPVETTFGGGFQVVIQTSKIPNSNILTREELLRHVEILEQIANYSIEMFGETWFLSDICFKPPPPATSKDVLAQIMEDIVAQIIPCVWITPIDCFWEGSKPLGPFPPLDLGPVAQFIPSIPNGQLEWKTLNPGLLLNSAKSLIDVGMVADLFDRAGIGAAYQDRACIDPLDPECPKTAPNYFHRCKAYEIFVEWNGKLAEGEQIHLEAAVKGKTKGKRDTTMIVDEKNHTQTNDDVADYYDNGEENAVTTESPGKKMERQKMEECEKYGHSFMEWIRTNRNKLNEFLPKELMPNYPNYGETMTGGCKGFGKNIMNWPEDLIVGGIKREANGFVQHAEAFQTVFLVASANDVHHRVSRSKSHYKSRLDKNIFTPGHAGALIQAWQRNFTRRIYEHPLNKLGTRIIHPLASTSIQDMLEQFSEFQFLTIFIGYVLMIFYAGWTQLQWEGWWFSPKSSCMLAVMGVLVITLASVAGLGLSTAMGIHFNAATTQIVPFLTLGLGIDDMFLLLHNYNDVLEAVKEKEVAVLLKETGMSILITSINNILAFMTGSILPIPALRSFCGQTAILLTSNVICIILLYPAFIALDLKRRKAGYRDMSFGYCCHFVTETTMEQPSKKKLEESSSRNQLVKSDSTTTTHHSEIDLQQMSEAVFGKNSPIKTKTNGDNGIATKKKRKWYTLSGFLYEIYIPLLRHPIAKATILLFCSAMFLFGCMGLYRSKIGLELADVLPEHTAPAAFLKAREKYFSFYPMFIVPKGPEEGVDYPHQQSKLEQLRADIAKSDFVIKIAGKPEPYWMMFMRAWLHSLQSSLDRAAENGLNATDELKKLAEQSLALNFTLGDDFYLARRLLCSKGLKYNCSESANTKLIDSNDIIDPDGFYNYLTAWFHLDNMMYYVSQAAFFPTPPTWHFQQSDESVIPPTDPLIYSQIPFYMNGLTDTPAIVQMINQIRDICDRYTREGLPIFPTGIPFTFWEQYLHLNYYLFTSILIIGTAVLLVISLIIFNPWAAAMVAIIVVSMTVELAGFMGLFGVKTNPISAVTLITAVGIGVEFTAHVVLAFLTSLGSRDERMVSCLEHMFIPVIHGGLSTLLGIIMLAFSEFDFVVKYFFVVMTALIIIGLINGLALLPVLLSLIGPPCEITPNDGSALLPCPPSARFRPEDSPIHSCFLPTTGENKSPDKNEKRNDESSASPEIHPNAVLKQHQYHESMTTLNETSGEESNPTKSSSSNTTNGARNSDDTSMRF